MSIVIVFAQSNDSLNYLLLWNNWRRNIEVIRDHQRQISLIWNHNFFFKLLHFFFTSYNYIVRCLSCKFVAYICDMQRAVTLKITHIPVLVKHIVEYTDEDDEFYCSQHFSSFIYLFLFFSGINFFINQGNFAPYKFLYFSFPLSCFPLLIFDNKIFININKYWITPLFNRNLIYKYLATLMCVGIKVTKIMSNEHLFKSFFLTLIVFCDIYNFIL